MSLNLIAIKSSKVNGYPERELLALGGSETTLKELKADMKRYYKRRWNIRKFQVTDDSGKVVFEKEMPKTIFNTYTNEL
jgi:hypothetical protein